MLSEFQILVTELSGVDRLDLQRMFQYLLDKDMDSIMQLKEEALKQIIDNQYYVGLTGEVLCVGVAHDKKRCDITHKVIKL